jgi:hypothetical protein
MHTNNFTFLVCHLAVIVVTACSSHLACGSVRQMGRSRTDEGTYWDIMDPILGPVARALPEPKSAAQLFPPMARHLCHNSTMRGKHLRTSFASVIHASRAVTRVIHTSRALTQVVHALTFIRWNIIPRFCPTNLYQFGYPYFTARLV